MAQAPNPIPPADPASTPKIQPWIIVVVVVVLACCFCIGLFGILFAFMPDFLHELGLDLLLPLLKAMY